MVKYASFFVLALATIPTAKAARYPHYFGKGATYKVSKGNNLCPTTLYLDAFPSTGLRINGEEIGREVMTSAGWLEDSLNPFKKGVGIQATAELRTEPCSRLNLECNGSVRTDERYTIYWSEDFKKMAIEKKERRVSTGGFLSNLVDETLLYKCQYKQVR